MICLLTLVSLAKGVGSETEVVEEQIKAGAAGIKTHEGLGCDLRRNLIIPLKLRINTMFLCGPHRLFE